MKIWHSICFGFVALLTAAVVLSQTYPSFPGGDTDQRTRRTQERVEELYMQGAYDRAYFIYRKELAPRGDKYAQYMIGYMHLTGAGVPEDPAIALAWYRLAAERGESSIELARDELEESLSAPQMAAADALFAELKSELSDRVLIFKLVQEDLDILRNSVSSGSSLGAAKLTVIDRQYGFASSTHYYEMLRKRLNTRLNYLKGQVEIIDAENDPHMMELSEIETEIKELIAEIDARQ